MSSNNLIFHQELILEKILLFSDVNDWMINRPPLISKEFNNIFLSEPFAESYLSNMFSLSKESVALLQERIMEGNEYSGFQGLLNDYIDSSFRGKRKLTQLIRKYSIESNERKSIALLRKIELECLKATLAVEICKKVKIPCDLVITDGGIEYTIENTQQFWKGGLCKDVFIGSIKKLRENVTNEEGGMVIEATVFMGYGYPLRMTFMGDYSHYKGDAAYFSEGISVDGVSIFVSEEYYSESTNDSTYKIMNNFLSVETDQVPTVLDYRRVCNTILYHWFTPFLHGKSGIGDDFHSIMKDFDFDSPDIYCDSMVVPRNDYTRDESDEPSKKKRKRK